VKVLSAAVAGLGLIFFCIHSVYAEVPGLEPGIQIAEGGGPLKANFCSIPFTTDWNNDGKKDLIVGQREGYIHLYLNDGTDLNPAFDGYIQIESDGIPIKTSYT
jgi:hypothetical protein